MQIHNDTKKDLVIAFGSNPDNAIIGNLKAGATDDLPVEEATFFNILEIKEQKMEIRKFKVMAPEEAKGQEATYLGYYVLKGKDLPKPDIVLGPVEEAK